VQPNMKPLIKLLNLLGTKQCMTLLGAFVVGVLFVVLFNSGMSYTNTTEFCISCHSMKNNMNELQETMHWKNPSGVHAGCPDCHVPKPFLPKMKAKIIAVKDVAHEILGTVDTPEKFEARRWHMASLVWERMRASDSRECRNCHGYAHMDFEAQIRIARKKHNREQARRVAGETGKTCIDCHQGVAHTEPDEPDE